MSVVYYGGSGFVPAPQSKEHAQYYRLLSNIASKESLFETRRREAFCDNIKNRQLTGVGTWWFMFVYET
jgi:hypothetical protein